MTDVNVMTGFLLIDKPAGPTSHDVVDTVRRLTGEKRVGHAGTLDPFATGLLIVGVGREATREFPKLSGLDKSYEATFVLGATSDTDDRTGRIKELEVEEGARMSKQEIQKVMKKFVGEIEQIPPRFSAIKIGGKKMYEAARQGKPIEAKSRHVKIDKFELIDVTPLQPLSSLPPLLSLRVHISCSSGTYIRALARDLGRALGCGAYVSELRRTCIGPFPLSEAKAVTRAPLLNIKDVLARLS